MMEEQKTKNDKLKGGAKREQEKTSFNSSSRSSNGGCYGDGSRFEAKK
jgi:hypothetical protein